MLGEEPGVDGVVVKQLVPRGSADRTGKVRQNPCAKKQKKDIWTWESGNSLFLGERERLPMNKQAAGFAIAYCLVATPPLPADMSFSLFLFFSLLTILSIPPSVVYCPQIKSGDHLLKVGEDNVVGQKVADMRHLIIGELGSIVSVTLRSSATGQVIAGTSTHVPEDFFFFPPCPSQLRTTLLLLRPCGTDR